jgi:uncharacterized repeat protein (TIGR01451 family)
VYFQDGGTVTIQSSVITGNQAGLGQGGNGGGVGLLHLYSEGGYGAAGATIADTTISGNSAPGYGGGLLASGVELTLTRSTVSGNTGVDGAAGVGVSYANGTIENSTIAENTTDGYGGGLYAYYADVTVKETTISGNTALGDGPGIYAYAASGVTVLNSIVANNGPGADLLDDSDSFFDVGHSLIENEDVAQINDLGGNIFGVDPQLGPLQNNGGPTLTMKPAATSPAVNAGDPAFTPPPSTDQRGLARVVGGRIDMGAVELNAGTVQFSLAAQNVNENAGTATVTVTRTGGTDGAASAQVSVNGASTATGGGADYTFAGATVNFPDNSATPQVINISIVSDATDEPNETIVLDLGSPAGAALGAPATHTITILDDDLAPPPAADVSILKSLVPGSVTVGDTVTFNLAVSNGGPDAAADVVVTDTLPAQLTFVSATPSAGSCAGTVVVTCNLGTLAPSGSATVTIVARMTQTGPATNVANVTTTAIDNDPADNTSQVTFTIAAPVHIGIPTLDQRMLALLASLVAAAALGMLTKK